MLPRLLFPLYSFFTSPLLPWEAREAETAAASAPSCDSAVSKWRDLSIDMEWESQTHPLLIENIDNFNNQAENCYCK